MARQVTPAFSSVPDVVHRPIFTLCLYAAALRKGAGSPPPYEATLWLPVSPKKVRKMG
jgi:hypothetical protein